jgi:LuxR family maltose regulon positive regulatory protein
VESFLNSTPIIQTKLQPPRLTSDFVVRPLLFEKLNSGLEKKLTLVSAPAGYGKTTLIASWVKIIPFKAIWISLEENDNDLLYFLQYLIAAIRNHFPASCKETLKLAQADYSPPPELLAALFINDINEIGVSIMLAVDDFHHIHDTSIRDFVSALLTNQPSNLHIVLLSRSDPLLPLSSLRASGQLLEIRAPDLRFEDDQAQSFLEKSSEMPVDFETVAAVNAITEGWITGLRLIVLAVSNQDDLAKILAKSRSSSVSFVNEYLFSEVLGRLSESLRSFMLRISILDRLSASLCDVVLADENPDDSNRAFLERLRNENVFLIPLDTNKQWYRFHHLFQALLVKELKANYSDKQIEELHRRASIWFAKEGLIDEAIHHSLAAHDLEMAANFVEQQSQNLLNSLDRHTLERWLSLLPKKIIWRRSRLIIAVAWLLFREWRLNAMDEALNDAASMLGTEALHEKEILAIKGQIASLQALSACFNHRDFERGRELAENALVWLPPFAHGARSIAMGSLSVAQQALGDQDGAVSFLEKILYSPAYSSLAKIQAFTGLALVYQAAAELVPMKQVLGQYIILAEQSKNPNAISAANRLAGRLAYERNEIEQASEHFDNILDVRYRSNFVATFDASLGRARIFIAIGDVSEAQKEIDLLHHETMRLQSSDLIQPVDSFQAYLWLIQGDIAPALRWARSINPTGIHESLLISEVASLTRARILIDGGITEEVREVIRFLKQKLERAQATYYTFLVIQVRIQLALAYSKVSENEQALHELEQAVLLAQPGGFIRSFTDIGSSIYPLLTQLHDKGVAPEYVQEIQASFPKAFSENSFVATITSKKLLTPRQIEILTLLQKGYSYQEISSNLTISVNTVKKHVSNIYENLEVKNRQQAIYLAKEMKLIS